MINRAYKICMLSNKNTIVTSGLKLHLDAANSVSYPGTGTTWFDLSGNNYNGTMSNITYSSTNGGILTFNGTSSFITTTLDSTAKVGGMPVTVEFWINSDSSTPVGIFDSAPNNTDVLRNYPGGTIEWWNSAPAISMGLSASTWTHIVAAYSTNANIPRRRLDLFRNGATFTGSSNQTGSSTTWAWTGLRLGDINNGTAGRYAGKLAIFRVYNIRFTATEALQNYNAQKGRFGL